MITDFMTENEVSELLQKKRTALYNLRKKTRLSRTCAYTSVALQSPGC